MASLNTITDRLVSVTIPGQGSGWKYEPTGETFMGWTKEACARFVYRNQEVTHKEHPPTP
jgi:hypothetical protein